MNKRAFRTLICSMLLGDGYIGSRDFEFGFGHSLKQQDYALWKAEKINSIFREKNLPRRCKTKQIDHKVKGKTYPAIHVNMWWKDYFKRVHAKVYKPKKGVEYILRQPLEDIHLAIWFMDDGSETRRKTARVDGTEYTCNPYLRLHTYAFTEGQHNLIREWFSRKYQVEPKLTKTSKGIYIRFTVKDSEVLFKRIRCYLEQVESMRDKFQLSLERY